MKKLLLLLVTVMVPWAPAAHAQDRALDALQNDCSITRINVERKNHGDSIAWEATRWLELIATLSEHPDFSLARETDDRRSLIVGSIQARDTPFAMTEAIMRGVVVDITERMGRSETAMNPFNNNARTYLQNTCQALVAEIRDYQNKARVWFRNSTEQDFARRRAPPRRE